MINNYFITGPSTTNSGDDYYQVGANQKVYATGNFLDSSGTNSLNGSADNSVDSATPIAAPWSSTTASLLALSASNAVKFNLAHAGANATGYDQVDSQVIADVSSYGASGHLWTHQTSTGIIQQRLRGTE